MEYWNDLALYFGTHRPNVTSELRLITPLEVQVFEDAMIRPRFAILRLVLDLSEYETISCIKGRRKNVFFLFICVIFSVVVVRAHLRC